MQTYSTQLKINGNVKDVQVYYTLHFDYGEYSLDQFHVVIEKGNGHKDITDFVYRNRKLAHNLQQRCFMNNGYIAI